jgi:serine/threonine protein phosphatase PrpC
MTQRVAGRTNVGLVRRRNEDAMYAGEQLFAVADGLGGHVGGDVASTTAIEALTAYDRPVKPEELDATLGQAVAAADLAIRRRVIEEPQLAGMGTTLVALLRCGSAAVLANVGDSRAYLLRGGLAGRGRTVQITEDHTYRHLVSAASRVPNLPDKLARFLDGRPDGRSPDLTRLTLYPGDRLLLCTDGLSSYVGDDLIHRALVEHETADEVAGRLVQLALNNGAPDNVTVLVLEA